MKLLLYVNRFALWAALISVAGCSAISKSESKFVPWGGELKVGVDKKTNGDSVSRVQFVPLWTKRMPGAVLSMRSVGSGHVLVATVPDSDIPGSSRTNLLTLLNSKGSVLWSKVIKDSIRDIDLAQDHRLAVVSTHGDQVIGLDLTGKIVWQAQGTCRVRVLKPANTTLCFHDDDADSKVAFDLFDSHGRKLVSFPIKSDSLVVKVSADHSSFAVGLSGGTVLVFSANGNLRSKMKVLGEVSDVAVSSQTNPRVAVLIRPLAKGPVPQSLPAYGDLQNLTVFEGKKVLLERQMQAQTSQIEFSPLGSQIFYDVHGPQSQQLGSVGLGPEPEGGRRSWLRGTKTGAVYPHPFLTYQTWVIQGVETQLSGPKGRGNSVLVVSSEGELLSQIKLKSDEGSFIYGLQINMTQTNHPGSTRSGLTRVHAVTDDGRVLAFIQKT